MTIKVIDQETGSTVEFPDGTGPDVIKSVMSRFQASSSTAKPNSDTPKPNSVSGFESFRRGAAQGLSLGFRDEIYGALRGAKDFVTGGSFGEGYNQGVEESRALDRQAQEANPGTYLAGSVAGGVAMPALGMVKAAAGAGLGARSLAAAKEGAAYGGAYGVGQGEGLEGKLTGGAVGLATGGAFGAAAPGLIDVGTALVKGAGQGIRAATQPRNVAAEKMVEAQARDNMVQGGTIANALSRADNRLMQAQALDASPTTPLGTNWRVMIADVGGENTRNLMRAATNMPSAAAEQLRKKVDSRQNFQWSRIEKEISEGLGQGGRAFQTIDDLEQAAKTAASPLFKQAYATKLPMTERLSEVLGRPHIRRLYELAAEQAQNEGKDIYKMPPLEILHNIKMQIDRQIGQVKRGIQDSKANWDARTLTVLKNDLKNSIEVPAYRQALETYSGPMGLSNAIEDGLDEALNVPVEAISKKLASLNGAERAAYRMGAARAIMGKIRGPNVNRDRTDGIFGSPDMQMRLRALYPSVKGLRRLQARLVLEAKMADTRKAVQGNSTTARQLAQGEEAGQPVRAVQAVGGALTGKIEPVVNFLSRSVQRLHGLSPAVADEIVRMGMSTSAIGSREWARAVRRAERDPVFKTKLVQRLIAANAAATTPAIRD